MLCLEENNPKNLNKCVYREASEAKKLKVLMANKLYYPVIGGIENHVRDLARELSSQIDVRVLVANTAFQTTKENMDGVDVYRIASVGSFKSTPIAPSFPCWLKKLESDIYHFHFPYPFTTGVGLDKLE